MAIRPRNLQLLAAFSCAFSGLLGESNAHASDMICPAGLELYGEWAGGFCCNGTVSAGGNECIGTLCALDPTQTQGFPICYEDSSPLCRNMGSRHLYGGIAGGFCCDGTLTDDKNGCVGNVCALDSAQTQGNPLCAPMQAQCPQSWTRYGEWSGGFCCSGQVSENGDSCSDVVCALDPNRSQGNPVCTGDMQAPEVIENGMRIFSTSAYGGLGLRFAVDAAAVVDLPNGVSIEGTVSVQGDAQSPAITLGNATLELTFDASGYVETAIGTATASLPNTGDLSGLDVGDLARVIIGFDSGANLKNPNNPQYIDAPIQDDRQYLVYSLNAGFSASFGPMQFSSGGVSTLIVIDPRDPSFYFRGDLSGLTGLSGLQDVGIGMSAQGLLAFEHDHTWGIENDVQDIDGNLLLQGSFGLPAIPISLSGEAMVRMPTVDDPVTHLGINGGLSVGVDFCPGVSFSVPLGDGSMSAHLGQSHSDAYFSGLVDQNLANFLPVNLPISLSGELRAAGRISSTMSQSFLKVEGNARVGNYDLLNAFLLADHNGLSVSGRAQLPGFQLDVTGYAGSNSASLNGALNVNIPILAPKVMAEGFTESVACGTRSVECGWNVVTSSAECAAMWTWCLGNEDCMGSSCKTVKMCDVTQYCDVWHDPVIDPTYHYGYFAGNVQVGIHSSNGSTSVNAGMTGAYCTVEGLCAPAGSMRVVDIGGAGARACADISPFGEFCVDL